MPDTIKTDSKPLNYQPKTLAAIKMVNHGVSPKEALQIVNNTDKISNVAVHKFKKKINKYSLTHPSTVKLAKNQIVRILAGEPREEVRQKVTKDGQVVEYTEKVYPTDTNISAIAFGVYDRYEPVIARTENVNVNVSPVDLAIYRSQNPATT